MKKLISIILCLCSVFGMFVLPGYAEDAPFYSLTFNADGGEFDNGEETKVFYLHEGDAVSDILPPERTAYEFKGWNKALPEKMPANNLTFSAVWEAIPGADPEDGKIPIEKVELNIYINRVYADVSVNECGIEQTSKDINSNKIYSFNKNLEKYLNGKWIENFTNNSNEKIGAGKYRWKLEYYVEYDFSDEYKLVPELTHVFIDGIDNGTLDYNYSVFTKPFVITDKDKRPANEIIKEIKIDNFREPKVGEPLALNEEDFLFTVDNRCFVGVLDLVETASDGNINIILHPEKEIAKSGSLYTYTFLCFTNSPYYSFSKSAKLFINGKKYNLTIVDDFMGFSAAKTDVSFLTTHSTGVLGFFETIILYIKTFFNSFLSLFSIISKQ